MPLDPRRLRDDVEDLLRDERRVVRGGDVGDEDRELVAAHARDGVLLAEHRLQTRRDHPQQLVAEGVAERVVDELERIEVEEHHRHRRAGAARVRERHRQSVAEERAVGKAGEGVVVRLVLDLRLGEVALGDVAADGDDLDDGARLGVEHRAGGRLEPHFGAAAPECAIAERHRSGPRERLGRHADDFVVLRVDEREDALADHLGGRVAEDRLDRWGGVEKVAGGVTARDEHNLADAAGIGPCELCDVDARHRRCRNRPGG